MTTTLHRLRSKLEVDTEFGTFLGDTRIRLLEAIDLHGSISQAAKAVPISYKAAWDAVDAMNNLADQPLVVRSTGGKNGGGTLLTNHGRKTIALYRALEAEYQSSLFLARQGLRHALINEARFLAARNDVNRKTQQLTAGPQKLVAVARLAQGLRGHGAHLVGRKPGQPLAKAGQAIPAALHGLGREVARFIEPTTLANRFFEVFSAIKLAAFNATNLETEAVRAQVYRRQAGFFLHGEVNLSSRGPA